MEDGKVCNQMAVRTVVDRFCRFRIVIHTYGFMLNFFENTEQEIWNNTSDLGVTI